MDLNIRKFILDIIKSRNDLTLATLRPDGFPQANTLSYAHEGMVLYFGTGRDSQKVRNLQYSKNVSLTIDVPYTDWNEIRGLSMGATAQVLPDDAAESKHAMDVLTSRYPTVWDLPQADLAAIAFVKIVPKVVSVLDYRKGFGHTDLVQVQPDDLKG
jgi:nitroimidazol reductase NimA-like FMN-containing flavoprotein (pyridoxamine 5'-phosphate oxidase superfamily)